MDSGEATALLTPDRVLHLVAAALCADVPLHPAIDGAEAAAPPLHVRRAECCLRLLEWAHEDAPITSATPSSSSIALFAEQWVRLAQRVLSESPEVLLEAFDLLIADLFESGTHQVGDTVLGALHVDESFAPTAAADGGVPAPLPRGLGTDRAVQRHGRTGGGRFGPFIRRCLVAFESLPFEAIARLHEAIRCHAPDATTADACTAWPGWRVRADAVRHAAHRAVSTSVQGGIPQPRDCRQLLASSLPPAEMFRHVHAVRHRCPLQATDSLHRYYDLAVARAVAGLPWSGPQEAALAKATAYAYLGHPSEAAALVTEAVRVAQQTNDAVCLSRALAWMSRLGHDDGDATATDERQRLRLLRASRDRAPRRSYEAALASLAIARTLMNVATPLAPHEDTAHRKWRAVRRELERARQALVDPAADMHPVYAMLAALARMAGECAATVEAYTELQLRGASNGMLQWTITSEEEAEAGQSPQCSHPTVPLACAVTDSVAQALVAYAAQVVQRYGRIDGARHAVPPLISACAALRHQDADAIGTPQRWVLYRGLARIVFECALARNELSAAAAVLTRLCALAPPVSSLSAAPSDTRRSPTDDRVLPDALYATLDALEGDARLRLARGEHVDALTVAALYHDHAAAYVHDGCRARLIDALLLQCACRLRAAGIVDGDSSSTVTAPALPYALTAAALAESLADRPLHRRARLALAQVYLGMRNIAAAAEHLQALWSTADVAAKEEEEGVKVKAVTRSVPDAESGWSGDERARWCLLRASWCLLQEEEEEEEATEQRWNRKSEALANIQHALRASDSVHRRRDAAYARLLLQPSPTALSAYQTLAEEMEAATQRLEYPAGLEATAPSSAWERDALRYVSRPAPWPEPERE